VIAGAIGGSIATVVLLAFVGLFYTRRRQLSTLSQAATPFAVPLALDDEDQSPTRRNRAEKRTNMRYLIPCPNPLLLPKRETAPVPAVAGSIEPATILARMGPSSKRGARAVRQALANAGLGNGLPGTLLDDSNATHEVVDRVLELLAARMDDHQPEESVAGTLPPPEYRDTRPIARESEDVDRG